jgi:DNA-binding NtrC family response regulator
MKRILFVDDEQSVLDAIRRSLRSHRMVWDMQFANSPAAALELLAVESVDVIVSDFRMPDMDGGELLAVVRERWPHTVRLILSGYSGVQQVLTSGGLVQEYLNKPCSVQELEPALDRALALSL